MARQHQEDEETRARELFERAGRDASPEPAPATPVLEQVTSLDKTLKLRWEPVQPGRTEAALRAALSSFGPVDSLLLSTKKPGTAVVAFESIVGAVRWIAPMASAHPADEAAARGTLTDRPARAPRLVRWCAAQHAAMMAQHSAPELEGVQLSWAQGAEPAVIARLPELANAAALTQAQAAIRAAAEAAASSPVPSSMDGGDEDVRRIGGVNLGASGSGGGSGGAAYLRRPATPGSATGSPRTFGSPLTSAPGTASPRPGSLFAAYAAAVPSPMTAAHAASANRDYENLTLMRLRQAQERQRLIAEMQQHEEGA